MLALFKAQEFVRAVDENDALQFPHGDGVIYVSPALAGWVFEDYALVEAPEKPETPEGMVELSATLGYRDGALVWDVEYEVYRVPVPDAISDRQFFQILAKRGLITKEEARAAVKTGELPDVFVALIDSLPEEERFDAQMLIEGATEFRRVHPIVDTFAAGFGMSAADIDQLWIDAHNL